MKLKRFICLILTFMLLSTFVYGSDGATESFVNNTEYAQLLSSLGIMEMPDAKADWSNTEITNREFLSSVLNMTAYNGTEYYNTILPTDEIADTDEDYNKYVYVYSKGWLKYETGVAPGLKLTQGFALTLVTGALGYTQIAENGGADLVSKTQTKLMRDVKTNADGTLSLNAAVTLLRNAIDVPYCDVDLTSNRYMTWDVDNNVTILGKNKDIYKIGGRVNTTELASINNGTTGKGHIVIDSTTFKVPDSSYNSFIGRYVQGYARMNDEGNEILYLTMSKDSVELVIDGEYFDKYTPGKVTYYNQAGRLMSVKVNNPVIIYNGKQLTSGQYSDSIFDIVDGSVTLVENKGVYDVIIVQNYHNLIVGAINTDTKTVYDMLYENQINLDSDTKMISLKNAYGEEVKFENLKKKNVITYIMSMDKEYVDATVGGIALTETLTETSQDGTSYDLLKFGSVQYTVSKEVRDSGMSLYPGNLYDVFININGRVAGIKASSTLMVNLGYMTMAEKSDMDSTPSIKYYTPDAVEDTDYVISKCAKNVKVDGKACKGNEIIPALMNFDGGLEMPISYKTNSSGEITEIDTPYFNSAFEDAETALTKRHSRTDKGDGIPFGTVQVKSQISYGYRNHLNGIFLSSYDGMCIMKPDATNEISFATRIGNDRVVNTDIYTLGSKSTIAYFTVANDTSSTNPIYENNLAIVEKISGMLNSNGQEAVFIQLNVSSQTVTYEIATGYENIVKALEVGDLIRYALDTKGKIMAVDMALDYSARNNSVGYENYPWNANAEHRVVIGKVYETLEDTGCTKAAYKDIVVFYKDSGNVEGSLENTFLRPNSLFKYSCVRGKVKVEKADISQVRTYKDVTTDADIMVLTTSYGVPGTNVYIISTDDL